MSPGLLPGALALSVAFMATAFAIGSSQYAFGLLVPPIEEAFGWSRTAISASLSFTAIGGLAAPVLGRWMDRHGVRPVLVGSTLVMAVSYLLRPWMSELWHWYALSALQYVAFSGASVLASGKLVGLWFAHARGRALGFVTMGNNFGGLVMPPLVAAGLVAHGWEGAYVVLGAFGIAVAVFGVLAVREPPEADLPPCGAARPGAPAQVWTAREALRTPAFHAIVAAVGLGFFTYSAILPHVTAHLVSRGVSAAEASAILAVLALLGMVGKLAFGMLAERIGARTTTMLNLAGQATFALAMIPVGESWLAWLAVPLFGLFMGGFGVVHTLLVQEAFGIRHFGAIMGLVNTVSVISFGVGPLVAGISFDATGSYAAAFAIVAALFLVAVAVLATVRLPVRHPGGG